MTAQELFNATIDHLVRQGRPGSEYGKCRYRTKDGRMCGVGCHITDEEYNPSWDKGYQSLPVKHIQLPQRLTEHSSLLREIQWAHDGAVDEKDGFVWNILRDCMRKVGMGFDLDISRVVELRGE